MKLGASHAPGSVHYGYAPSEPPLTVPFHQGERGQSWDKLNRWPVSILTEPMAPWRSKAGVQHGQRLFKRQERFSGQDRASLTVLPCSPRWRISFLNQRWA